jgi:antitoxin component YwqK of YwqJK toxin-antitoxin module
MVMVRQHWLRSVALILGMGTMWIAVAAADDPAPQRSSRRLAITPRTNARAPATPPAEVPLTEAQIPADPPPAGAELIEERFTSGDVKVRRYVVQDDEGNYVNHGPWTHFNQTGNAIGGGSFEMGRQQGKWYRILAASESKILSGKLYKDFKGPFRVDVDLVDGKLHGSWTVTDSKDRMCSEWHFDRGLRNGKSTWFHANGQLALEVDYVEGVVDGHVRTYNGAGEQAAEDLYIRGRKHGSQTVKPAKGRAQAQGQVLFAPLASETGYDWWNCEIETAADRTGVDEKHGDWTWWYPNGQTYCTGHFDHGQPVGKWVFWHANGQKQFEGQYIAGVQTGEWRWWRDDGTLEKTEQHGEGRAAADRDDDLGTNQAPDYPVTRPSAGAGPSPAQRSEGASFAAPTDDDGVPEVGSLRLPPLE